MKCAPGGDNLVKGVQYYELFRGIALRDHALLVLSNSVSCLKSMLNDAWK